MSAGKCLSIVPYWPIIAILLVTAAGIFVLMGTEMVTLSVGIEISRTVVTGAQISVAAIILLDLIFMYSVLSNKLRIHNAHCNAEGCRGYRIKDAAGCCSMMLRCLCKIYNLIVVSLVWFTVLLAVVLCCSACWSAGISLSLVGLCQTSRPAVDLLLDALKEVGENVEATVVGNYITVKNGTTADTVCDEVRRAPRHRPASTLEGALEGLWRGLWRGSGGALEGHPALFLGG